MGRVVPNEVEVVSLVVDPALEGLVEDEHAAIRYFGVLSHEFIEVGRDDLLRLPQDGDRVGRKHSCVVEQIHHPVHEEQEEGEEIEEEYDQHCRTLPVAIVLRVVDCGVLALLIFAPMGQPLPKS